MTYLPAGGLEATSGASACGVSVEEHYRFAGKEAEEDLGLSYFGARYLSSPLMTFISADQDGIFNNTGAHKFLYVSGRFFTSIDPDGNSELSTKEYSIDNAIFTLEGSEQPSLDVTHLVYRTRDSEKFSDGPELSYLVWNTSAGDAARTGVSFLAAPSRSLPSKGFARTRKRLIEIFRSGMYDSHLKGAVRTYRNDYNCPGDLEVFFNNARGFDTSGYMGNVYQWNRREGAQRFLPKVQIGRIKTGSSDLIFKKSGKWYVRIKNSSGSRKQRIELKPGYVLWIGWSRKLENGKWVWGDSHAYAWMGERPGERGKPYVLDGRGQKLWRMNLIARGASRADGCPPGASQCFKLPGSQGGAFARIRMIGDPFRVKRRRGGKNR
jgi:RHS repeat-associated protein